MISRRSFHSQLLALATATFLGDDRRLSASGPPSRFEPLPPDLPLPGLPTASAGWIRDARVLQPWGETQYLALTNVGDRPKELKRKFGFNVLMAMPAPAHNAITPSEFHLTEAQFREAIAAFRRAGYKLMLYSSIIHCGHAPQWQSGEIEQEHPDWSQLDAEGNAVTDYGHPWICPNSPGRGYTLHYTKELVKTYRPDAVMLDDNGFYHTNEGGWSCYCRYCQEQFRDYALRRCGQRWLKDQLDLNADEVSLPVKPGPMYGLWLRWRNRVWAEANEVFRKALRQVDPAIVVFGNTLFDYKTAEQSSDLQYSHEDCVFSESHFPDSWYMSEKMLYGQAIAAGERPLWNYIATFEDTNFGVLRPPDVALPMLAASLVHRGLPWLVYRGFHQPFNKPTLDGMSSLLSWYAAHSDLFSGDVWTPVAALVSTESRNALDRPLFPDNASFLLMQGAPLALWRADHISSRALEPFSVITAETCEVMSKRAASALAAWTKAGGKLIAHADVAAYDEMGRRRPRSLLWESLGFSEAPVGAVRAGRGQVFVAMPEQIGQVALEQVRDVAFGLPPGVVEVVAYQQSHRVLLHVVQHMASQGSMAITVPAPLCSEAQVARWHQPGQNESLLRIRRVGRGLNILLPHLPPYSVIELET